MGFRQQSCEHEKAVYIDASAVLYEKNTFIFRISAGFSLPRSHLTRYETEAPEKEMEFTNYYNLSACRIKSFRIVVWLDQYKNGTMAALHPLRNFCRDIYQLPIRSMEVLFIPRFTKVKTRLYGNVLDLLVVLGMFRKVGQLEIKDVTKQDLKLLYRPPIKKIPRPRIALRY